MRRLLILTAAAALVVTASAAARTRHHHRATTAPAAEGAIPADALNAHDAYVRNLHDSGYNAHSDLDAHGNMRTN
jgi:hypothetical protein